MNLLDKCEQFDGIMGRSTCCARQCGTCGGNKCNERPGGKTECCNGFIPDNQICGIQGQKAPCHLPNPTDNSKSLYRYFDFMLCISFHI